MTVWGLFTVMKEVCTMKKLCNKLESRSEPSMESEPHELYSQILLFLAGRGTAWRSVGIEMILG